MLPNIVGRCRLSPVRFLCSVMYFLAVPPTPQFPVNVIAIMLVIMVPHGRCRLSRFGAHRRSPVHDGPLTTNNCAPNPTPYVLLVFAAFPADSTALRGTARECIRPSKPPRRHTSREPLRRQVSPFQEARCWLQAVASIERARGGAGGATKFWQWSQGRRD